jgi:aldose 1-epimerase
MNAASGSVIDSKMSETQALVVARGDIAITVVPGIGARLHSLRVRGHELLRSPHAIAQHALEPFFWGGYVMVPWCNRLAPGPIDVAGRTVDLAPNFEDGSAIHGQVYAAPWLQTGESTFAIERDGDGWPWRYRVEMEYAVTDRQLIITQRLRNLSDSPMPGGIGLHPWFPTPVELRIDSSLTYGSNKDSQADPIPVSGDLDVRLRQPMAVGVDATWARPADPPVELWWPQHELHATLRAASPKLHIVAANAPERGAIAVDPETHAPQGLRRLLKHEPGAMELIDPGEEIVLPITIDFDRG